MIGAAVRVVVAALALTAVLGLAYPAVVTGFARVVFADKANGGIVEVDGRPVGSELAAQAFTGEEYFHPRPSAVDYDAAGTGVANLGPTNPDLAAVVEERVTDILALEGPYDPGLEAGDIPVDAVTTSGSGIDPHISPAYAELQAARIASVRGISRERLDGLIAAATDGRRLGLFGEPGVNVLELNIALDREAAR